MGKKLILIVTLLIFVFSATLVLAPTEYVFTLINFEIVSSQEMTVTLRGEASGTKSAPGGNKTSSNIIFNTTTGNDKLVNATVQGGQVQDGTNPIITIDNSGTATIDHVNITINKTLTGCLALAYSNATYSIPGNALVSTSNVTLIQNYAWTAPNLDVWLFGNFTSCTDADDDTTYFHVFAYWT